MPRLFADCGNTAVKLLRDGDRRLERLPADAMELASWLRTHPADTLICCPGATAATAALATAWDLVQPGAPLRRLGVHIVVPDRGQYPGFGLDRLCAGIAAVARTGRPVVVIDAGTATTLTAWNLADDGGPQFAGGLILPSPHACLAGLAALAPALPHVAPGTTASDAAQCSTTGAIAAGIGIGYPAMVAACLERLQAETGCGLTVITGYGAAELATSLLDAPVVRGLVLDGLRLLA